MRPNTSDFISRSLELTTMIARRQRRLHASDIIYAGRRRRGWKARER